MGCTITTWLTLCLINSAVIAQTQEDPAPTTEADTEIQLHYTADQLRDMAIGRLNAQGMLESDPPTTMWSSLVQQTAALIEANIQRKTLQSELRALTAEVEELRAFIIDHERLGDDFQSYQNVLKETRRLVDHQMKMDNARRADAMRDARRAKVASQQAKVKAAQDPLANLKSLGFKDLGSGIMLGKSSYQYAKRDVTSEKISYVPTPGGGVRRVVKTETQQQNDYGTMTISGTLLNGTTEVLHVGIAIAFQDAHGNQIGQETIQVKNMRPNVPYPFTGELTMASDRPFATESQWTLYADPAEPSSPPMPTP
ncbi:MAG: FxLYD domain-containing protein [Phycisphaerales bacterium]|nr:FxLYD domain-containing protein [Phycisphaerales bacterium]